MPFLTSMAIWLPWLGLGATLLLVVVGLMNFSVFRKQLTIAKVQIDTAVRHLEIAQKQPDLHLIQRAISETTEHVRLIVERPYLRPYFYEGLAWREGDSASEDEVKAMAELILNNFASALMHSAAFPEYPVRGIDRIIMFHLRRSPVLREHLRMAFDTFPFTGLSMLVLEHETRAEVRMELQRLAGVSGLDAPEVERRRELLGLFEQWEDASPIQFTALTMQRRR